MPESLAPTPIVLVIDDCEIARAEMSHRLARAGWIMVREGVIAAAPGEQLTGLPKLGWRLARVFTRRPAKGADRTEALFKAVTRLGPSYVKLGQFLATRPDVVGYAIAADLATLADLADKLAELLADPIGATELGLAGQQAVYDRYHAAAMARQTRELYLRLGGRARVG